MRSFAFLACLMAATALTHPACAEDGPAVLFVAERQHGAPEYIRTWDDWLEAGFEIDAKPISAVSSIDVLQPYNVIVVNFLPSVDSQRRIAPEQAVFEQVMDQYLRAGGGVVVFCGGGQWHGMSPALRHLLKPYGALVPEEQIVDHQNEVAHVLDGRVVCNLTTAIAEGPMTRGILRIGYVGQASRADVIKLTMPLVITEEEPWTIVVRGEETAYSAVGEAPGTSAKLKEEPATYSRSPIMAAYRNLGKGRLFVYPHNVAYTITSPEVFDDYFWRKDDLSKPGVPQNRSFILQAVRWAAEPTLESGTFGGYETDRGFDPEEALSLKKPAAIDWAKSPTGDRLSAEMGSLRGLIGAQSTYSGGEHTIEQLCAAARDAGLDFLAFAEKLELLSEEDWEEIKSRCREASDERFLAMPGIAARDKVGNRWFGCGYVPYLQPTAATPDGTMLDNTYSFFFKYFRTRLLGFVDAGRNPNPWFEMKHASCMAVSTWEKGSLVDDAQANYFASCYDMENYIPIDYHVVATPEEIVAAAAGRVNVFTGGTVEDLHDYMQGSGKFQGRALFWESPHYWYLSSAPRLLRNGGRNLGNLGIDPEKENLFRYGFKLSGLAAGDEIFLMDGPNVHRKWIADGETFETEHTWPHEQARVFVVRVVRNGETLLLASPVSLHYGRRFNQCGDRQNTIPYNYQPDDEGRWHVCGIPIGCKYKSWSPATSVYATAKGRQIGAIGVEIVPDQTRTWFTSPTFEFDDARGEEYACFASRQSHRLSCPGVLIVDELTDRVYPDGGRHLGDCAPPKKTEPLQLFHLNQRRYGIYGMVGQLNGQLVESRISILRDVNLKPGRTTVRVSGDNYAVRENSNAFLESCLDGKVIRSPIPVKLRWHEPERLVPGDYVGAYPFGYAWGGAQYAVSDNLWAGYRQSHRNGFYLKLPQKLSGSSTFEYAIFYTTGGSAPHRPGSDYQQVRSFLGFTGTFPGLSDIDGGELLDSPVIATIRTTPEAEVRLRTVKNTDDPIGLTVRICGFQTNWQVAYLQDDSTTWRYFGELDGYFYANFYTKTASRKIVAGHPITCDHPELRIALDDPQGKQSVFEIYNPTGRLIQTRLKLNPTFFGRKQTLPEATVPVEVAAFTSVRWSLPLGDGASEVQP